MKRFMHAFGICFPDRYGVCKICGRSEDDYLFG